MQNKDFDSLRKQIEELEVEIKQIKIAEAEFGNELHHLSNSLIPILNSPVRLFIITRLARAAASLPWLSQGRKDKFLNSADKRDAALARDRLLQLKNYIGRVLEARRILPKVGTHGNPPSANTTAKLSRRVLIVAELSIAQCTKYRVKQKADSIRGMGFDVTIVAWQDTEKVITLLQTHSLVIFYRVPGTPDVLGLFDEARKLSVYAGYDIDDLVFDVEKYRNNPNLEKLPQRDVDGLLAGASLYRCALQRADFNIGSTPYLCALMSEVNSAPSFLVENSLDEETLEVSCSTSAKPAAKNIEIFYGSGSNTHDRDFEEAATAIVKVLTQVEGARLHIVGDLVLPSNLWALGSKVRFTEKLTYKEYLSTLAKSDISIAPLVDCEFNHAKSNIKFLEASALGVPSVCSPVSAFSSAIGDGINGFLAKSEEEWLEKLLQLCHDSTLRKTIGESAKAYVRQSYSADVIARLQITPLLNKYLPVPKSKNFTVLMVNVFYRPQSFGGATLLIEELVPILKQRNDIDVSIFTSAPGRAADRQLFRREVDGDNVFRFGLQSTSEWDKTDAPESWDSFREVLFSVRPDIVHFHSIQGFGVGLTAVCRDLSIPHCITLHDAWWLCARQFLVKSTGEYCGQQVIDHKVCDTCIRTSNGASARALEMKKALDGATALLAPSKFWRDFHIANGISADKVLHCENGISIPETTENNSAGKIIRFAFVAGMQAVKGFPQIRAAFNSLKRDDFSLVVVDPARAISDAKMKDADLAIKGRVAVVGPYNAETREEFFRSFDVLLFPSQWPESFGLTVREALIRNKWVISTGLGGQAEAIEHGVNGTLISIAGGSVELATAIEELLENKHRLSAWTNPNSSSIVSIDQQALQLMEIYRDCASKRRSSGSVPG